MIENDVLPPAPSAPALAVDPKRETDMVKRAKLFEAACENFRCNSADDYQVIQLYLEKSAQAVADAKLLYDGTEQQPGPKVLAHRTWKKLCDDLAAVVKPFEVGSALLRRKGVAWGQAQEAERRRLAVIAEAEQREREAKAEAERQRIQAEEDAARAAEIEKLAEKGIRPEDAEQLVPRVEVLAEPVAPAPVILPDRPRGGPTLKDKWEATVTDMRALLLAATVEGSAAEGYLKSPDVIEALEKVLTAAARTMQSTLVLPGVKVENVGQLARKGKR